MNTTLQQSANVFDSVASTPSEVESAGEKALVVMYNGKKTESLNKLRLTKYSEKVTKGEIKVEPRSLPPTSAAAKFHSYRVFLQVYQWKSPDCDLNPESWGWINSDTGFHPVLTDLPPAPDNLLRMIRCNCSGDCSRAWCSCKKHGTKCTLACGQCRGSACTNASIMVVDEEDPDSD